jgi:hypothetical protein
MKFAYTKKDGKINNKFALSDLSTINKDSYDEIFEVQSDEELNNVEVYKEPLTEEEQINILIGKETRELAIDSLKAKGKLDDKGNIKS